VPVGLTIFNVILLNEFPDYEADVAAEKKNLVARMGRERGAWLYGAVSLGSWVGMGLSLLDGVPTRALWVYVPVLALSLALTAMVLRGSWRDRARLEILCGLTIAVNLGTTAAYIFAFLS
jgi:1,4-dihydroxy-2-naphthoate octaprenyltransferase